MNNHKKALFFKKKEEKSMYISCGRGKDNLWIKGGKKGEKKLSIYIHSRCEHFFHKMWIIN